MKYLALILDRKLLCSLIWRRNRAISSCTAAEEPLVKVGISHYIYSFGSTTPYLNTLFSTSWHGRRSSDAYQYVGFTKYTLTIALNSILYRAPKDIISCKGCYHTQRSWVSNLSYVWTLRHSYTLWPYTTSSGSYIRQTKRWRCCLWLYLRLI